MKMRARILLEISLPEDEYFRRPLEEALGSAVKVRRDGRVSILLPALSLRRLGDKLKKLVVVDSDDLEALLDFVRETESLVVGETRHKSVSGFECDIRDAGEHYILYIPHTGHELKVPKRVVDAYVRVLATLKKSGVKIVKKRDLVSMVFRELGLFKLYEKSGEFHWEAFYGDRKNYHTYYYGPIKVVENWKLVRVLPNDRLEIL